MGHIESRTTLQWARVAHNAAHVHATDTGTFDDLAKLVTAHTSSEEKDGPAWMPANIQPGPCDGERVEEWCVLALDIEAKTRTSGNGNKEVDGPLPPPITEIADTLRMFGYSAAIATSHRHMAPTANGTLGPRYRMVFPVSRPIKKHEIKGLALAVVGMFGLSETVDANCLDPTRLFYLPRVPADRQHLAQSKLIDGQPLNIDEILGADSIGESATRIAPLESALSSLREPLSDLALNDLRSATRYLASSGYGSDYADWQGVGAALRGESLAGREPELLALWVDFSRACGGYSGDDDVLDKWRNVGGAKSGKGAIFTKAMALGWVNPAIGRKQEISTGSLTPNTSRFTLHSAVSLLNRPPMKWMVKGLIPSERIGAMWGASMTAKSFLALDLIAAVAEGHMWFGHRVNAAPVVYVALEGASGIANRIKAWEIHRGRKFPADRVGFIFDAVSLTSEQDVLDLREKIWAELPGALVIIDTLNAAAPTIDENTSQGMGQVLDAAKRIQAACAGFVMLIHHTGKAGDGPRGHSSMVPAFDVGIEVTRSGDLRTWKKHKVKEGIDGETYSFTLARISLGFDDDDDEISSCVVMPCEAPAPGPEKLTAREQQAYDTFCRLNAQNIFETGVFIQDFRVAFYAELSGENQDTKRKAANRAIDGLVEKGRICRQGEQLTSMRDLFD